MATATRKPRRKFDDDFKRKAVALSASIGRKAALAQLDIYGSVLDAWVKRFGSTNGSPQPRKRGRPLGSRDTVKRIRTVSTYPNRMSGILTELDHQADLADQKITDVLSAYRLGIHEGVKLVLSLSAEDKD